MTHRDSLPLPLCVIGSIAIHATIVLPLLGAALTADGLRLAPKSTERQPPTEAAKTRATEDDPARSANEPLPEFPRVTEAERITLGIDDGSDQPLVTWIGYDEYEKHLARLSEVEQAAMRMTAEGGGAPSSAPPGPMSLASLASPAAPPAVTPAAVTRVDQAADSGRRPSIPPAAPPAPTPPSAPPDPTRVTSADMLGRSVEAPTPHAIPAAEDPRHEPVAPPPAPAPGLQITRPAEPPKDSDGAPLPPEPVQDDPPALDPLVRPAAGAGASEEPPPAPLEPERPQQEDPAPVPRKPPVPLPPETKESATRASEPTPPASEPQPLPTPLPENADSVPEHDEPEWHGPPAPPRSPGRAPAPTPERAEALPSRPAPAPGPPVTGELTDREADPTSTIDVPADQWRNGKPLAARGLQILTRRPELLPEYLAVQRAPVRHPIFELSFDNKGVVRRVVMLESSGAPELDDRLIDCLYRWRARGERLQAVKPNDRLTLTMRMLVR